MSSVISVESGVDTVELLKGPPPSADATLAKYAVIMSPAAGAAQPTVPGIQTETWT